jgi:putative sterol carrier protein
MNADVESDEPAAVYQAVMALDDDEFDELMEDPDRRSRVIRALVAHMAASFRHDAAALDAVIHVKLWDRPGGGYDHFELVISDRECVLSAAPGREPDLTLKIRPSDLRALVDGKTGPRRLALKRRLTVLGDLKLGAQLTDLFSFKP